MAIDRAARLNDMKVGLRRAYATCLSYSASGPMAAAAIITLSNDIERNISDVAAAFTALRTRASAAEIRAFYATQIDPAPEDMQAAFNAIISARDGFRTALDAAWPDPAITYANGVFTNLATVPVSAAARAGVSTAVSALATALLPLVATE